MLAERHSTNAFLLRGPDERIVKALEMNERKIDAFWDSLADEGPKSPEEIVFQALTKIKYLTDSKKDESLSLLMGKIKKWGTFEDPGIILGLRRCLLDEAVWQKPETWPSQFERDAPLNDLRREEAFAAAGAGALKGGTCATGGEVKKMALWALAGSVLPALGGVGFSGEAVLPSAEGIAWSLASGLLAGAAAGVSVLMARRKLEAATNSGLPESLTRLDAENGWEIALSKWHKDLRDSRPVKSLGLTRGDLKKEDLKERHERELLADALAKEVKETVSNALSLMDGLPEEKRKALKSASAALLIKAASHVREREDCLSMEKGVGGRAFEEMVGKEALEKARTAWLWEGFEGLSLTEGAEGPSGFKARLKGSEARRALLDPSGAGPSSRAAPA